MNINPKWIELSPSALEGFDKLPVCPEFTRSFELDEVPSNALLNISGMGFYNAKINGQPVTENLLTPPFTAYDKRVYYEEYDVTALLRPGKNEITVRLGSGWYAETAANAWEFEHAAWHSCLKMIAWLTAGGECILTSDARWLGRLSNTVFSTLRQGETHDASAAESPWQPVCISRGPGGILEKYDGPGIRVEEILEPVAVVASPDGTLYDFGVNLSGNCEITVSGPRGSRICMTYAERVTSDNCLDYSQISEHVYADRFQTDEYILAGNVEERWHSLFCYHGFRYVMVSGDAKVLSVIARCFHTELPEAGGFECDNALINELQQAILRSTKTNYHHMPTDCPHREKNGWTGDAHLSAEQALFNFDIAPAYRKWMRDFHDAQRPNGMLPGIIPTSIWGYNWGNGVSWDCACVIIPWECYMATGDESFLRENFSMMEKYVDYMTSIADDGISTIGLGDWCPPDIAKPMNTPALLTAISIQVYRLMEKICAVTGLGCSEKYAGLAAVAEKAFRDTFITGCADNPYVEQVPDSQTFLSMLLWHGLTEDPADVASRLVRELAEANNHPLVGIFGAKYLFDALTDHGLVDLAFEVATKTDYPSWSHMLSNGSGTLWEDWEDRISRNHHMYSSIGAWFYTGIAGIRIQAAGYKKVCIHPHVPKGMSFFRAWRETPLGRLEVLWQDDLLTITAPENMIVKIQTDLNYKLIRF